MTTPDASELTSGEPLPIPRAGDRTRTGDVRLGTRATQRRSAPTSVNQAVTTPAPPACASLRWIVRRWDGHCPWCAGNRSLNDSQGNMPDGASPRSKASPRATSLTRAVRLTSTMERSLRTAASGSAAVGAASHHSRCATTRPMVPEFPNSVAIPRTIAVRPLFRAGRCRARGRFTPRPRRRCRSRAPRGRRGRAAAAPRSGARHRRSPPRRRANRHQGADGGPEQVGEPGAVLVGEHGHLARQSDQVGERHQHRQGSSTAWPLVLGTGRWTRV